MINSVVGRRNVESYSSLMTYGPEGLKKYSNFMQFSILWNKTESNPTFAVCVTLEEKKEKEKWLLPIWSSFPVKQKR